MGLYATADQAKLFAQEGDALSLDGWAVLLASASRLFDNLCEVSEGFFDKAPTSGYTSRDFYGDGTASLTLDPFVSLNPSTPVVIDDDEYEVPEYVAVNNTLVIKSLTTRRNYFEYNSWINRFAGWRDGIKVTVSARWGFSSIPEDVKLATIQLALHQWRGGVDPVFAQMSGADAKDTAALPEIVMKVVDSYRGKYTRRALFA